MIAATLYQTVYLMIVAVFTIYIVNRYRTFDFLFTERGNASNQRMAWVLTGFMMFFIGLRPRSFVFGDMGNYYEEFTYVLKGRPFEFNWEVTNFLFDNIFYYWGSASWPVTHFFLLIAIIYFGCIMWACRKMFPDNTLLMLLTYLGAFSTFSYATNGIKAGAAASLFLLAIAYRNNRKTALLFIVMTLGFHHSMAAPVAVYVFASFVKERRYYLYAWMACFIMAALHITVFQELFAGYTDNHGASYLSLANANKDVSGFRPDFILYSAIPIFLAHYLIKKYGIESETYNFLLNLYTGTNAVFLLCTYASYINRIAYLSWLMYPFVLIYPFLKENLGENQYRYLRYAVYGHLGFTLFMFFVYY